MIGNPDFVNRKKMVALFVDGDFWHGYDWKKLKRKLKNAFWANKIRANIKRDKTVSRKLKGMGWKVNQIWEHEINTGINRVVKKISGRT